MPIFAVSQDLSLIPGLRMLKIQHRTITVF